MHGSREAIATIYFVDQYCSAYQKLFPEVRSFECFKFMHVGMISELKRKSLPAIAKVVGLSNPQPLHHFLAESRKGCRGCKICAPTIAAKYQG